MVFFWYITEEIELIVNSIDDGVEEAEYERTGALIDVGDSWDWLCFKFFQFICPWSMLDQNKNNKKLDEINKINILKNRNS